MARGKSNEELAQIINDYLVKAEGDMTRNRIKSATSINGAKLDELEELGLVKLPKKVRPGANSKTWRSYKPHSTHQHEWVDPLKITQHTYD
jgi:hypothetical protein